MEYDIEQDELSDAAMMGDIEGVRNALASDADPEAFDSVALGWAADKGCVECVRLLVPVSDAKAGGSRALRWAAWKGHAECVRELVPFSDVERVRAELAGWMAWEGALALMDSIVGGMTSETK